MVDDASDDQVRFWRPVRRQSGRGQSFTRLRWIGRGKVSREAGSGQPGRSRHSGEIRNLETLPPLLLCRFGEMSAGFPFRGRAGTTYGRSSSRYSLSPKQRIRRGCPGKSGAWVVLDAATGDNIWDHELARIQAGILGAGALADRFRPGNYL